MDEEEQVALHLLTQIERLHEENERLQAALSLGVAMRAKQKIYFKDRSRENLIASKEAECVFDRAALKDAAP